MTFTLLHLRDSYTNWQLGTGYLQQPAQEARQQRPERWAPDGLDVINTDSFPNFRPCFQLGTNWRKPNMLPDQSHRRPYFYQLLYSFPRPTPFSSPAPLPASESLPKPRWGRLTPLLCIKPWINSLCLFMDPVKLFLWTLKLNFIYFSMPWNSLFKL